MLSNTFFILQGPISGTFYTASYEAGWAEYWICYFSAAVGKIQNCKKNFYSNSVIFNNQILLFIKCSKFYEIFFSKLMVGCEFTKKTRESIHFIYLGQPVPFSIPGINDFVSQGECSRCKKPIRYKNRWYHTKLPYIPLI